MQKTLDQEIEENLKDVFSAFGKNPRYEKDRIRTYCKYLLKNYELFDIPHFEEVCETLILTRDFLPTVNEITDCYDFLLWCKRQGHSKEQRKNNYRDYMQKGKNNGLKTMYELSKTFSGSE